MKRFYGQVTELDPFSNPRNFLSNSKRRRVDEASEGSFMHLSSAQKGLLWSESSKNQASTANFNKE